MSGKVEQGLVDALASVGVAYPRLPQPVTFPAIRYQRVYTTRQNAVDGTQTGPLEVGMQIDCMAETYAGAKTLADSVRTALNRYTGAWAGTTCLFATLETENDFSEDSGDKVIHWVSQRYRIWTNDS